MIWKKFPARGNLWGTCDDKKADPASSEAGILLSDVEQVCKENASP
ncbi:hypothetical protein ABTX62_10120 [Streptomyces sp. NPDC096046]